MYRLIKKYQDIEGMSRVGMIEDMEIYVNTDDGGNIPHFHIRDRKDWDKFHTCILITKPWYFLHEGKEDMLNSHQRKELDKFMKSKVSIARYADNFENNWKLICFLWDINNSGVQIPEDATMPDYIKLDLPSKAR